MVEGITSTQSLGGTKYGAPKKRVQETKITFESDSPNVKQASANLAQRLSAKERKHIKFSAYGEGPHEDADMWYIELWSGQWREEYERDEKGNLYSGGRGRGHLPQKKVVRRYPHMVTVPVEEHCNTDLFKYYDKGFMLEEDMPEDVRKELKEHRKKYA